MNRRPWVAAAACVFALAASGTAATDAARRAKPLALPAVDADTVAAVRLDADVYAASDDLDDLRVLDAAGAEVPCLTRTLAGDKEVERQERTLVNRQPFRIEAIEFWHEQRDVERSSPVLVDRPPAGFRVARDAAARTTRVTVETRREPLTEFTLATDDRNFSRRVTVERAAARPAGNGRQPDRRVASATLTRIDVAGIHREQLAIPIPESRAPEYVLVIDDGDSPPIGVTGVSARGPVQEVVFLAQPGGTYRIAYGGHLARPRYDTAAIAAALAAGVKPIEATTGPETASAMPAPDPWHLLADTRVQVAIIAALVVVLAITLFRAARRIDAAGHDE